MAGLAISNLYAGYGAPTKPILKGLDLTTLPGEITVIVGPSGGGKTTLLNLIAGFILPSKGSITLDGNQVNLPNSERAIVFQEAALLPWKNVWRNISYGLALKKVELNKQKQKAEQLLELVKLKNSANKYIWQLSGGQKQRVNLARALAVEPKLLLLDEPFSALDTLMREQMQLLLLEIWQQQKNSIFLITHDIEEALLLASRLLFLSPVTGQFELELKLDFNRQIAAGTDILAIKKEIIFQDSYQQVINKFSSLKLQEQ